MQFVKLSSSSWLDEYDQQRIASYDLYDDLFNNDPSTFHMMLRASDEKPIYIPTAKKIIKVLSRYVGRGWGYRVIANPVLQTGETAPTTDQIEAAQIAFGNLFARERLLSRYRSSVTEWLRRGDWLWYVSADPSKRSGSRISVRPIDPRRYFPMFNDPSDASKVTGQQLIEETMIGDVEALKVQTWVKVSDPEHPNYGEVEPEEGFDIAFSVEVYATADYNTSKRKLLQTWSPLEILDGIQQLPIYHIRNNETTDDPFGRSDLSGLETIVAGINQTISDEDLSLAIAGLGMYVTDAGAPVDETTGVETSWKIGPARVVEVPEGSKFTRVDGIDDVQPYQDHVEYMEGQAQATIGLSDVSTGTGSATGESGVALAIRYAPLMDEIRVKDETSNAILTQMFYDLKQWFLVYEGLDFGNVEILSETDPVTSVIPFDRETRWSELMDGVTAGLFTKEYAISILEEEFGYEFPAGYVQTILDAASASAAAADPFATRTAAEVAAE